MCVCVCDRERENECECVYMCNHACACVHIVCMHVCSCVHVCTHMHTYVCTHVEYIGVQPTHVCIQHLLGY